jgi:carbon-monoxide dehydrogenase iron sulfur subunit
MKKIVVREEWCLGCHLCEYACAFANSGKDNMSHALRDMREVDRRIYVEGDNDQSISVNCRQCKDPICVAGCISGALRQDEAGMVTVDQEKCVNCGTCVLTCPYGVIEPLKGHDFVRKCELCIDNSCGRPLCVEYCPNLAIVLEEVGTK